MMRIIKLLLTIIFTITLLGEGMGRSYALRPMATRSSDLEPAKKIADGLNYADIAFDLIDKNAQLAKEYSWAEVKKRLIEFLDPLFQKSSASDFQSFLNRIEIGLRDHLKDLNLKDVRLSRVAIQDFEEIKELLGDHNIYKNDTFLDEFHQRHIFIDTNLRDIINSIGKAQDFSIVVVVVLSFFFASFFFPCG